MKKLKLLVHHYKKDCPSIESHFALNKVQKLVDHVTNRKIQTSATLYAKSFFYP